MLKKRVLTVFLSLLACLCCCFSGFGSVNAYALSASFPQFNLGVTRLYCYELENWFGAGDDDVYSFVNNWDKSINSLSMRLFASSDETDAYFTFPIIEGYDYYLYTSLGYLSSSGSTFVPTGFEIFNRTDNSILNITEKQSFKFVYDDVGALTSVNRYAFLGKINIGDVNSFGSIRFSGNSGILLNRLFFECSIFLVPSGSDNGINDVVNAINDQTMSLGGKLEGIEQSIEDQYQMENEEDFGFSDIQQQYEEKMGVLTFGTETTLQMLDLFSPSNAGDAYIRVPGWSMEIQGETYQIWDEYIFYFDSIEENFPFLVTTMRTFTVAMFYVAIVGYITKVYERNFLAK